MVFEVRTAVTNGGERDVNHRTLAYGDFWGVGNILILSVGPAYMVCSFGKLS